MALFNHIIVILLFFFTSNASAMWVKLSDCDLINKSVMIVQAEFTGTTSIKLSNSIQSLDLGVLQISHVFKGYKGNNALDNVLVEQPNPTGPRSSDDIFFTKGQKGIWFLTEGTKAISGIYSANDYQRYWPEDKIQKLNKLLDNCPSPE